MNPVHTGKMNFYLSAVDDMLWHPDDQPSIGIILCRTKNEVVAEYALRDPAKPVGNILQPVPGSTESPTKNQGGKEDSPGKFPRHRAGDSIQCYLCDIAHEL